MIEILCPNCNMSNGLHVRGCALAANSGSSTCCRESQWPTPRDASKEPIPQEHGGQPNRFVWFFRLDESCEVGNACAEYRTDNRDTAIEWYEQEYGGRVLDARRRELTFAEYAGLLRCNFEGHGRKVYAAIQDLFFRCDPRGTCSP